MAKLHLIEGPVGAGKSTFGESLSYRLRAPFLCLDDWMATLFRPDRPDTDVLEWYVERKQRCIDQMVKVATSILEQDSDVVVEIGLVLRSARAAFFERLDLEAVPFTLYVLDAPREVRRARVRQRNAERGATWSMDVPDDVFDWASDLWEDVDDDERDGRDVVDVP